MGGARKYQSQGYFSREFNEAELKKIEECAGDISTWDFENNSGYLEGKQPCEKWDEFCKSELYTEIITSPKFAERLQTGEKIIDERMKTVPANFNKHKDRINDYFCNTLNIDDDMPPVNILLTVHGGVNLGANRILWGHKKSEDEPTYDPVFLSHEWMHSWADKQGVFSGTCAEHPICELATNEALTALLGGKSENIDFTNRRGEPEMRDKIRPYFLGFCEKTGAKNFVDFHKDMIEKFGKEKNIGKTGKEQ